MESRAACFSQAAALNSAESSESRHRAERRIMKTLGVLLILALAAVLTLAYDSVESHESYERYNPFVNQRNAHSFMGSQVRGSRMNERIRERNKSPQERQREVCEEYRPCERYALRNGYSAAYRRYFGNRNGK